LRKKHFTTPKVGKTPWKKLQDVLRHFGLSKTETNRLWLATATTLRSFSEQELAERRNGHVSVFGLHTG
jgi:hypothetical protein